MSDMIEVNPFSFYNDQEAKEFWNRVEECRDKDILCTILPAEPPVIKSALPSIDDIIREKINSKTKNLKHFKKLTTKILKILYEVGE